MSNILGGFRAIGIWQLNAHAVEKYLGPSQQFVQNTTYTCRSADDHGSGSIKQQIDKPDDEMRDLTQKIEDLDENPEA